MIRFEQRETHLKAFCNDRMLFQYVIEPDVPDDESPRPYFHPLYTWGGADVTDFRPDDHRWQHGLSLTCAYLSGLNFWGGPTYVCDKGYTLLPNHGQQRHVEWTAVHGGESALMDEGLAWVTPEGDTWLRERRIMRVSAQPEQARWTLHFDTALANCAAQTLVFGSPTTEGRPQAGYGGLYLRGRGDQRGSRILIDGRPFADEDAAMGQVGRWMALVSAQVTVILVNRGRVMPWFVRVRDYLCASFAFSFYDELTLPVGDSLALAHSLLFCDGARAADEIEALARLVR